MSDTPNIDDAQFRDPEHDTLGAASSHPPKILLLYGSLRKFSYSRYCAQEAERILQKLGADTKIYHPDGLPLPDSEEPDHPKVAELRDLATWCEGFVWVSPERHGAMTGIMKSQIDWIPLSMGGVRPTQGKTLAVAQVNGGSQSFNTVNQLRILGRWMRLLTIPNQSSIPVAFNKFQKGRLEKGSHYNRLVDVMEELVKFTLLTRDRADYLVNRYSERVESADEASKRVNSM